MHQYLLEDSGITGFTVKNIEERAIYYCTVTKNIILAINYHTG